MIWYHRYDESLLRPGEDSEAHQVGGEWNNGWKGRRCTGRLDVARRKDLSPLGKSALHFVIITDTRNVSESDEICPCASTCSKIGDPCHRTKHCLL